MASAGLECKEIHGIRSSGGRLLLPRRLHLLQHVEGHADAQVGVRVAGDARALASDVGRDPSAHPLAGDGVELGAADWSG